MMSKIKYYSMIQNLINDISKGKSDAVIKFYSLTYQQVYYFLYFCCKNRDTSIKVLQNAYIIFLQSVMDNKVDKNKGSYHYYLFIRILYGTLCNELKVFKHFYEEEEIRIDDICNSFNQESIFFEKINTDLSRYFIKHALGFGFKDRCIFLMKYYLNLDNIQISSIMLKTRDEIKKSIADSLKSLREHLEEKSKKGRLILFKPTRYFICRYINDSAVTLALDNELSIKTLKYIIYKLGIEPSGKFKPMNSCLNLLEASKKVVIISVCLVVMVLAGIIYYSSVIFTRQPNIEAINYDKSYVADSLEIEIVLSNYKFVSSVYLRTEKGKAIQAESTGPGVYKVEVKSSQRYILTVKSFFSKKRQELKITNIDRDLPYIEDYEIKGRKIYLNVDDVGSGVDYPNCYILNSSNKKIKVERYDEDERIIVFPFLDEPLTVYMKDKVGNLNEYEFNIEK